MRTLFSSAAACVLAASLSLHAQQNGAGASPAGDAAAASGATTAAEAPNRDTSYIDAGGAAHITRVVPIPDTVSPEAQQVLARRAPDSAPPHASLAEQRERTLTGVKHLGDEWSKMLPNQLVNTQIAGIPVRIVTPGGMPAGNSDKVLLEIHGGGFNTDSGSYTETIPIAGYTRIKVVGVLYRMAPEHPFPAGVDDVVTVYKELLKSYSPRHIAIYGTSAGAILTGEVAARIKQLGLPLPAALGIFSGLGDFARNGDSRSFFNLRGLAGELTLPSMPMAALYTGKTDPKDPVLSPIYSDLRGMPPTLFISSERDMLLSGTINLHRAFLRAGADARLVVFDALPHAFWYNPALPESIEANRIMADFFVKELGQ